MKVNLGCGRSLMDGWVNVDVVDGPGVDLVRDLDGMPHRFPWKDGEVDEWRCEHTLEHLYRPLPLLQEMWRCSRPDAVATFWTPHGSSDDAWEDPTHVRAYFEGSWVAFSAPYFWRASYDYFGDWQPEEVVLVVEDRPYTESPSEIYDGIRRERNLVREMKATLRCVKPARAPERDLMVNPKLTIGVAE